MKYDYNALMKEIYEEVRALGIPVSGNIEPEVQITDDEAFLVPKTVG